MKGRPRRPGRPESASEPAGEGPAFEVGDHALWRVRSFATFTAEVVVDEVQSRDYGDGWSYMVRPVTGSGRIALSASSLEPLET